MGGIIVSQLRLRSPGAAPDMRQQGLCGQNVWEVMGEARWRGAWDAMAGCAGRDGRDAWDTTGGMRGTRRAGHVGHDGQGLWDTPGGACGMRWAGCMGCDGQGLWDMTGEAQRRGMWDNVVVSRV